MDRLAASGLVTRKRDPEDGRVVRVSLTAAGRNLEDAAARVQATVVCQTTLSPDALAGLREQLHDLILAMRGESGSATRSELVTAWSSGPRERERT